jgi:hypothetical protein
MSWADPAACLAIAVLALVEGWQDWTEAGQLDQRPHHHRDAPTSLQVMARRVGGALQKGGRWIRRLYANSRHRQ